MAGVNLLTRLNERLAETDGVPIEKSGGLFKGGFDLGSLSAVDRTRLVLMGLGIVLIWQTETLLTTFYTEQVMRNLDQQIAEADVKIAEFERVRQANMALQKELDQFETELTAKRQQVASIEAIKNANRDLLVRMTDFIVRKLPQDVWLESLVMDVDESKTVSISVNSLSLQNVSETIVRLETGVFFPKWNLGQSVNLAVTAINGKNVPSRKFDLKASVVVPQ